MPARGAALWGMPARRPHARLLHPMPLALRLRRRRRGRPPRGHRAAARASHGRQAVPQGTRRAGARLSRRPADAPAAAHCARRVRPTRLAAHLLGRGARRDRRPHGRHQGRARAGAGRILGDDAERLAPLGLDCLDRALHPRLRQPQHHLRDRDLQLAQGFRLALHVRHRHRHARLRPHRLRAAVGQQPRHHLARAGDRGAEGGQARRAHDRGRPPAHRLRQARGPVAAGAPRHRPGARARARQPDDRAGCVRPRFPSALDQRAAAGARGHRALPASERCRRRRAR